MNMLEEKIKKNSLETNSLNSNSDGFPMFMYNSKCFFCDQKVKCKCFKVLVSPDFMSLLHFENKKIQQGIGFRGQKLVPSYSKLLTTAKDESSIEHIFKLSRQLPGSKVKFSRNNKIILPNQSNKTQRNAYKSFKMPSIDS